MEIQDVGHSCRKSWMAEEFDLLGLFVLYEVHISHSNDCPPPPHTPFRCLLRFRRGVATLVLGVADKPLTFEPDKWTNLQPPFPASLPSPTTLHLLHLELPSQPLHQEHKNQTDWKEKCLNLNVKTIYYHFSIRLERSASWLIHIHSNTQYFSRRSESEGVWYPILCLQPKWALLATSVSPSASYLQAFLQREISFFFPFFSLVFFFNGESKLGKADGR